MVPTMHSKIHDEVAYDLASLVIIRFTFDLLMVKFRTNKLFHQKSMSSLLLYVQVPGIWTALSGSWWTLVTILVYSHWSIKRSIILGPFSSLYNCFKNPHYLNYCSPNFRQHTIHPPSSMTHTICSSLTLHYFCREENSLLISQSTV